MIRLALIGCGMLGRTLTECISRLPEAQFLAYADIKEDAAQSCLHQLGSEYATAEIDRIFADDSISAVYSAPMTVFRRRVCAGCRASNSFWEVKKFSA